MMYIGEGPPELQDLSDEDIDAVRIWRTYCKKYHRRKWVSPDSNIIDLDNFSDFLDTCIGELFENIITVDALIDSSSTADIMRYDEDLELVLDIIGEIDYGSF